MEIFVDTQKKTVTLWTNHPVPEGRQGTPGYCEHTFDWQNLHLLIMRLMDAAQEIGPGPRLLQEKLLDFKAGRY